MYPAGSLGSAYTVLKDNVCRAHPLGCESTPTEKDHERSATRYVIRDVGRDGEERPRRA